MLRPESPSDPHTKLVLGLFLGKEEHCAKQGHCSPCHTPYCQGRGKDSKGEVQGNHLMWKTRSGQAEKPNIFQCLYSKSGLMMLVIA